MSLRRSPVTQQGPQGPRTMNSLRSRRPPANLNLIVTNPDSDGESDTSHEIKRPPVVPTGNTQNQSQQDQASMNRILQQQGGSGNHQGFTIIAQPPTPSLPPVHNQSRIQQQNQQPGPSGSMTASSSMPLNSNVDRTRTSLDDIPFRSFDPSSDQTFPISHTVLPGMMTAPQSRSTTHRTLSNAERSLPRIHTPPAYPIPLPPGGNTNTSTSSSRNNEMNAPGVPGPAAGFSSYFGYFQQQKAMPNAIPGSGPGSGPGSIGGTGGSGFNGGSPVANSSPSSPNYTGYPGANHNNLNMAYPGSNAALAAMMGGPPVNATGSSSGSAGMMMESNSNPQRRRYEAPPTLPPRPKQNLVGGNSNPPFPTAKSQSQSIGTMGNPSQTQQLGSTRLAVTVDNENFSVVDVSGMANAEAIMERVFAKVS
jgi:hypothetical protein